MPRGIHIVHCYTRPTPKLTSALQQPRIQSVCFGGAKTRTRNYALGKDEDEEEGVEGRKSEKGGGGGFQLYKSRGQHLLCNPLVLDSIVRKAHVHPTDTVLEIGPGTGNLTLRLLASARSVVAVEIDDRMVDVLVRRASQLGLQGRLTVIRENALRTQFPHFDVCVANIPYGISSPLIAKLLLQSSRPCSFRSATLLLQKEFARRLLAAPGDSEFNRLAANVGLVATVDHLMDVSKRHFVPCPKVDSSLVKIRPRPHVPAVDLDEWVAFTRRCFSKKNKTLGAIFKQKRNIIELFRMSQTKDREAKATQGKEEEEDGGGGAYGDSDDNDDDYGHAGGNTDERERVSASDVGIFKEKIVGLLRAEGFEEKRPSKLSNDDLLHLLQLFNQMGVLFR